MSRSALLAEKVRIARPGKYIPKVALNIAHSLILYRKIIIPNGSMYTILLKSAWPRTTAEGSLIRYNDEHQFACVHLFLVLPISLTWLFLDGPLCVGYWNGCLHGSLCSRSSANSSETKPHYRNSPRHENYPHSNSIKGEETQCVCVHYDHGGAPHRI